MLALFTHNNSLEIHPSHCVRQCATFSLLSNISVFNQSPTEVHLVYFQGFTIINKFVMDTGVQFFVWIYMWY